MIEVLDEDQFELLTDDEQARYLSALGAEVSAWTLTEKQLAADRLADQVDECLMGGAAGPGKSEWVMHRALRLSLAIPGHASLLLRTSFPELRRSLIRRSIVRFASLPVEVRPKWRAAEKEWKFPNGSVIEFGYCETDDDVGQYLSAEYDFIAFDELTEFSLYQYNMIRSRARTTKAKLKLGARPHVVGATNPGRRGHAWVKALFVTATDHGRLGVVWVREVEDGKFDVRKTKPNLDGYRRVAFESCTVLDNPHIDPGYVSHLMSLPAALKRQYLEGDWDVFEGQYFNEFQQIRVDSAGTTHPHHVVEPFEIPPGWPKVRCIDWGWSAPFCCLWLTYDEDGACYVYRELWQSKLTPEDQAEKVKSMSVGTYEGMTQPEKITHTMADPSAWHQKGSGFSIAQQWLTAGLQCRKANNDRVAGWQRVREYLKEDADGDPGLRIFSTCTNLIRTIPEMIHDKNHPEDLDTTLDDHGVDALRYGLMDRQRFYRPKSQQVDTSTADGRALAHLQSMGPKKGRKKGRVKTDIGSF